MTKSLNGILLYRATKDGFTSEAFHEKCDGKAKTVTIIMTNEDYVFGGYTATEWKSLNETEWFITDPSAFVFSLRRNGVSQDEKFLVAENYRAIFGYSGYGYGPTFGALDIAIKNRSDINNGSISNFCWCFQCPSGYTYGDNSKGFLAGSYIGWLTTEIEVYQITNFY
jgi:hypothetical protein